MKQLIGLLAIASALSSTPCRSAPPTLTHCIPSAVTPGGAVEMTVFGTDLASPSGLWTSFPATVAMLPPQDAKKPAKDRALCRLTVPADIPVGIGAIRVVTAEGISGAVLVMIDDLPSVAENGANKSLETAQPLSMASAVDGACEAETSDYYKFTAAAGQRITLEVVARRLGSPLDAMVRLLDSSGNELALGDDDIATGPDSRLAYKCAHAGTYILELRDVRYQGGTTYRYRLRLGDFPLPAGTFPLAVQKGTSTAVQLVGDPTDGPSATAVTVPHHSPANRVRLETTQPAGQGSSWVTLLTSTTAEQLEREPNDAPDASSLCDVPGAIEGRFDKPKDRDFYYFEAKKGQRLLITGQTRSLGSPTDLFLRLYKADGGRVKEVDDSGGEEAKIDYTFPADGVFRLEAEDVTGRSGPEFTYRILIEPYRPTFSLSVDVERIDVPAAGTLAVKVVAVRSGYAGPITLKLEGVPQLQLRSFVIPQNKNDVLLTADLGSTFKPGQWWNIVIVGEAKIEGAAVQVRASTSAVMRRRFSGLALPPPELDGSVGVGVGPEFPEFYQLMVAPSLVSAGGALAPPTIKVQARKLNNFDDQISLAVDGLPKEVVGKKPSIEKGKNELALTLANIDKLAGRHTVRVSGTATFQNQTRKFKANEITVEVQAPIRVAVVPMGPLQQGGKQKVMLDFDGNVDTSATDATYESTPLGSHGPRPPAFAGFEGDNLAAGFSGVEKGAAERISGNLAGLSASDYSLEFWLFNSRDLAKSAVPISAYVFSRHGKSTGTPAQPGDHLGIGGTMNATPRDRLFLYNGKAILPGKTALPLGTWHHVVLNRSGEEVKLYLDGETANPEIQGRLQKNFTTNEVFLGARSDGYAPLQGTLDEVAMYNGTLSPSQIQAHYSAARGPASYRDAVLKDGPLAYWRFDEVAGRVAQNIAPRNDQRVVMLAWQNLPPGVVAPDQIALRGGTKRVELELAATGDIEPGKKENIAVKATIKFTGRDLVVQSPPVALEITKP